VRSISRQVGHQSATSDSSSGFRSERALSNVAIDHGCQSMDISKDNKPVLALRYISLVALTTWVGGLLVLAGVVTPSTFDVLGMRGASEGRVLAGEVFDETVRRFHFVSYACGGVVALSLLARRVLGPRPRPFAVRFGLVTLMLAATAYSAFITGSPRMTRATLLELIPLAGGLFLLFWELKD
jgi:hypothetical protein